MVNFGKLMLYIQKGEVVKKFYSAVFSCFVTMYNAAVSCEPNIINPIPGPPFATGGDTSFYAALQFGWKFFSNPKWRRQHRFNVLCKQ